ncbi:hypothetical protein C2S53_009906 [Perilla frutescens var. hirtella]|uniref:Pentatricopeptide repeat-containing protein n=1 Tax=Perilla frutescens var. hirtella TaxID=608512 RepID=A0AAD4INF4_PERFH|nr:hypothetical protein C2S53_009906 [Perilla frutescens var. hirtella]
MNCLLSVYAKCGRVEDTGKVFELLDKKYIVSWNSLINALSMTFESLVSAVARQGSIEVGRVAHGQIITSGFELDKHVGTVLVSLYSKCRKKDDTFQVFEQAVDKDVVFWTTMISGLVQNDSADNTMRLFQKMLLPESGAILKMAVDILIKNSLVSLYANCGLLDQSFTVFSKMDERNVVSWNAILAAYAKNGYLTLVDMYAKSGNLDCARKCFIIMPEHDSVSWTAIIAGYGSHGKGEAALQMFSEFLQSGLAPNDVIFLSALYACNHNGLLVDSGMVLFESMIHDHKLEPKIEHVTCIVDLLSWAGRVQDAYNFYRKMFAKPMIDVLGTLLDACLNNGHEELGRALLRKFLNSSLQMLVGVCSWLKVLLQWVGWSWRSLGSNEISWSEESSGLEYCSNARYNHLIPVFHAA